MKERTKKEKDKEKKKKYQNDKQVYYLNVIKIKKK